MSGIDADDELTRRARARVGSVLKGKWTIDQLIGIGGMAAVYAATHRNKKRVAIKMLHTELSVDRDIRARFLREGYVANSVEHPGTVHVDDDDVADDGAAFLVMELLEGESVEARRDRKGGRLAPEQVVSIAHQLLEVLVAAHDKGIVHRDLKPENLFVNRDGRVKVLDFGIARVRELREKSSATRTGSLMGTPAFMAPEQARGRWELVDARTDLWAAGATMFTLLTGRYVHEAETPNEALALAITQRSRPIASLIPEIHPALAEVVDKALAYDQSDRYPDAHAMQEALRAASAKLSEPDALAGPPALSVPDAAPAPIAPPQPSEPSGMLSPGASATAQVSESSHPDIVVPSTTLTTSRAVIARVALSPAEQRKKGSPAALLVSLGAAGLLILLAVIGGVVAMSGKADPEPVATASAQPVTTLAAAPAKPVAAEPSEANAVSLEQLPVEPQPTKADSQPASAKPAASAKPKPSALAAPAPVPSFLKKAMEAPVAPKPATTDNDPFAKRR
jgi:eukaryotic-like serine/threonine-protein kinase